MRATYLVEGFDQQDHSRNVCILVDFNDTADMSELFEIVELIAGTEYCFNASRAADIPIPDDCKNIVFGDDELYARLPQLDWRPKRRRKSR